jgi:hypothetical protein
MNEQGVLPGVRIACYVVVIEDGRVAEVRVATAEEIAAWAHQAQGPTEMGEGYERRRGAEGDRSARRAG